MNMTGREKAGVIAMALLTALVAVSCVQTRTPPASNITFREASAANVPPAGSAAAPPAEGVPAAPPAEGVPAAPVVGGGPAPAPSVAPTAEIVVHITGAVRKPGVYHLPPGARGDDALKAAGGPTEGAAPDALNLAAHLEDGSQIHVPTRKEQAASSAPPSPDAFIKKETGVAAKPEKTAGKPVAQRSAAHSGHANRGGGGKLKADSGVTININTADAQTLQKLPGIGPAMADRILDYRKSNGGFKNPEELMEVSGIGPKKYAKMEPLVRVK